MLTGEFSFPPTYGYQRGFGACVYCLTPNDDSGAGDLYLQWLADASTDPCSVGVLYFEYRDEPLAGRGPGRGGNLVDGEHYAFGAVDETDRPKWPMIEKMRTANMAAGQTRLSATDP